MGKAESSFESIENDVILEKAIEIACRAHKGQRDKAGAPYILHPLRVMLQLDRLLVVPRRQLNAGVQLHRFSQHGFLST